MSDDSIPTDAPDLDSLVGSWLSVPEAAARQGVADRDVRRQIKDRELLTWRSGRGAPARVPEAFVTPEGPRPELHGTFTVLADGGMDDEEILAWLFTPDETLPDGGSPMDALVAGHKKEIRRRAMERAF